MVTVYSKPRCPQCTATTRWLTERGIDYRYRDAEQDPTARAEVQALGYLGVPVVVTGSESWQGFQPSKLEQLVPA